MSRTSCIGWTVLCIPVGDFSATNRSTKAALPTCRRIQVAVHDEVGHPPSFIPSFARARAVSTTFRSGDPGDVVVVHHSTEPFLGPARTMVYYPPGCGCVPSTVALEGETGRAATHPRPSPATWRFLGIPPLSLGPSPGGKTPVCVRHVAIEEGTGWEARLPRTDPRTDGRSGLPTKLSFRNFGFERRTDRVRTGFGRKTRGTREQTGEKYK